MKNQEVIEKYKELSQILGCRLPATVGRAVAKNVDKLKKEVNYINDELIKIRESYAEHGEDGKAVTKDGSYVFTNETEKEKCINEQNEFMNESVEIDFTKISDADLDKCDCSERYDVLTVEQNRVMLFMISE